MTRPLSIRDSNRQIEAAFETIFDGHKWWFRVSGPEEPLAEWKPWPIVPGIKPKTLEDEDSLFERYQQFYQQQHDARKDVLNEDNKAIHRMLGIHS